MVGGPAVGKAGDCLDWIAGGLEMKELKDIPDICHRRHRRCLCNKIMSGVKFSRLNTNSAYFTLFADICCYFLVFFMVSG